MERTETTPRRRTKPRGYQLTEAEASALREFSRALGGAAVLSAALGSDSPRHMEGVLTRDRRLSRTRLHALLALVQRESVMTLAVLEHAGSDEMRRAIGTLRAVPRVPTPRAGRGRATAATLG